MNDPSPQIGQVAKKLRTLAIYHRRTGKLHPAHFHYQEVLDVLEEMKGGFPVMFGGPDRRGINPKILKLMDDYCDGVKDWADKWLGRYGLSFRFGFPQSSGESVND